MLHLFMPLRQYARPVSVGLLLLLLTWLVSPEKNAYSSRFEEASFRSKGELALIQFDTSKGSTAKAPDKTDYFTGDHRYSIRRAEQLTCLLASFLQAGSFERNPFYVYTSINAP
ncbi:hypothetical protein QQ054_03495 [Oscillatoria amoena NRMC-F 0135]|nr:hypothetical protein [Oscillatoria amoena NRMC-F 0135]